MRGSQRLTPKFQDAAQARKLVPGLNFLNEFLKQAVCIAGKVNKDPGIWKMPRTREDSLKKVAGTEPERKRFYVPKATEL